MFVHGPQYIDEVVQYVPLAPGANDSTAVSYHREDLFSVMALTDESGNVIERFEYGGYGTPMNDSMTQFASAFAAVPFLFTGRFYDIEIHENDQGECGWYQFRAREMDAVTGRFISPDPIEAGGDITGFRNRCGYSSDNPFTYTGGDVGSGVRPT